MFGWLVKLIPKKMIVSKVSNILGSTAKEHKHQYLENWQEYVDKSPGEIDDASLLLVRQVVDPGMRSEEMTRALEWLIRDIERQTLSNDTVWDNGIGTILKEALEVQ